MKFVNIHALNGVEAASLTMQSQYSSFIAIAF